MKSINLARIGFYCINTIFMFLYIYTFRMTVFGFPPALISTRVGAIGIVLMGVLYYIFKRRKCNFMDYKFVNRSYRKFLLLLAFLFIFSFLQLKTIGKIDGIHMFEAVNNMLFFSIPVIWAFDKIYDNLDSFLLVLVLVGLIQSIIIIICLANDNISLIIDYAVNDVESETHNIRELRRGYAGGVGCISSTGAICFSTGLMASTYLYVKNRNIVQLIILILFAVLSSMISRIGLLFVLACILYIIKNSKGNRTMMKLIIPLSIIVLIIYNIISSGNYNSFIEERYHRYDYLKDGIYESFLGGYFEGDKPPLSFNTFWGVGMLSGKSGNGYVVNIDGGPQRIYSAIGLVLCIFVYFVILTIMYRNTKLCKSPDDRYFMYLLFVIYMISDFKEITYFLVYPVAIYFTIAFLMEKKYLDNSCLISKQ